MIIPLDQLLSASRVPPSTMADPRYFEKWREWVEERIDSSVNAPWADSVRYELNSGGYRGDELHDPRPLKIVSLGCSFTFGTGIPYESTYSYQVKRMLEDELGVPATNWNLSSPGQSADYIARMISSAIPALRPDLVIVNFSYIARREFIAETGRVLSYVPNPPPAAAKKLIPPEGLEVWKAFDQLASFPDDLRNLTLNFRLCESMVKCHGVNWCYSSVEPTAIEGLSKLCGGSDYIGEMLECDGRALDGSHPGPEANFRFAEAIMVHLRESGKLEALGSCVAMPGVES